MAERRSQYTSQEFDLEIYHPLDEVRRMFDLIDSLRLKNNSSCIKITAWLEKIQESSPLVTVNSTGKTHEGRDLLLVKISAKAIRKHRKTVPRSETHSDVSVRHAEHDEGHQESHDKPVIYINCGVHAREWVAVSSCIWIIDQVNRFEHNRARDKDSVFVSYLVALAGEIY